MCAAINTQDISTVRVFQNFLNRFRLALHTINASATLFTTLDLDGSVGRIDHRFGFYALVHILGGVVKYLQHGNDSVRLTVGSSDMAA